MTDPSSREQEKTGIEDEADVPALFDRLVQRLRQDGNWFARKRTLLGYLAKLEEVIAIETPLGTTGPELKDIEGRTGFIEAAPAFVACLLDGLGEHEIGSVEQAAFYLLSEREEHRLAARDWLQATPKRLQAFRRFVKANRQYREILADEQLAHGY
jgi:hypothetical protein